MVNPTTTSTLFSISFPYNIDRMPEFPESMKSHWSYSDYKNYFKTGTVDEIHRLIDLAIAFQQKRNAIMFCGEFGVYDVKSPDADRTFWYGEVRKYLEANNIAWTIWDYHGSFGIFNKGGSNMFYHDLNVPLVENLRLNSIQFNYLKDYIF